jgi:hypothetical protein
VVLRNQNFAGEKMKPFPHYRQRPPLLQRGFNVWPVLLCLALLVGCAAPQRESAATVPDLRVEFRRAYDDAIEHHRSTTIHKGPVIIQDLLGMTLIRQDGQRIRYEMDKRVYFALANNTHPPYGIYSIIALQGFGPVSAEQLDRLASYRAAIDESLRGLDGLALDQDAKQRLVTILSATRAFIDRISGSGAVSREEFVAFVEPLRPLFRANFHLAALEQLRQFRAQMALFKTEYPQQNWQDLRVVIMGFHQPRNLWTLKQFFQWLLKEPDYERRVVYAEFQHPFFGEHRAEGERLAIELLTKVDFDQAAGEMFLGDSKALGSDILGPYAREIIEGWGPSAFVAD